MYECAPGLLSTVKTMENRHILHKSWLNFCKEFTDTPILKLQINWSDDTSHVLVAVNNQKGQLEHIVILTRSRTNRLKWSGFTRYETFIVQVYGLKLDTVTGQERRNYRTTLYSVDSVRKIVVSPTLSSSETQERVADLSKTYVLDRMMESLGSQDDFEVTISNEAPMTYSVKPNLPDGSQSLYIIYNQRLKKEYLMMSSAPFWDSTPLLPICHSRTAYQVRAVALKNYQSYTFGCTTVVCHQYTACGKSKVFTIKTRMSKEELQTLLEKAESYCRSNRRYPGTYNIRQFYRNKPRRYYEDILENRAGLMEKYIKDNNGDPYSPINNQINGLFFSASLDTRTMRPPPFSYFGDWRLFVPAEELFTANTKMYFTDFFCHNQTHYVTIVLTKNGSAEDRFCKPRLLELDPKSNPFFTVTEQRSYQYPRSYQDPFSMNSSSRQLMVQKTFTMVSVNRFHVEFLYTEDVDIAYLLKKCGYGLSENDKVYFLSVEGRGESKKDGIPKKPSCRICNLDPPPLPYHFFPFD